MNKASNTPSLKEDYKETVIIASDMITGFTGKITGHSDYITGCDQFLVQPDAKDGQWQEGRWFDVGRLNIVGSDGVKTSDLQAAENGADQPAPIK